jgi:hypothetical protein
MKLEAKLRFRTRRLGLMGGKRASAPQTSPTVAEIMQMKIVKVHALIYVKDNAQTL